MPNLPLRYRLAMRVLDVAFRVATRLDPNVISVHAVRTTQRGGVPWVTDECVPPGTAYYYGQTATTRGVVTISVPDE